MPGQRVTAILAVAYLTHAELRAATRAPNNPSGDDEVNRYLLALLAFGPWCSNAFAQVTISNYNPDVGGSTVASGAITAAFSTPYTITAAYPAGSSVSVAPSATGNLATATFYDGMTLSGNIKNPCGGGCAGGLAAYLPTLTMADSFTITGSSGQIIPWTLTLVSISQFGASSSNVYDNEITEYFSTGGSATVLTGYGSQQACFSTVTAGCGGSLVAQPNNVAYTMTFSGTISSGGILAFNSTTSGSSQFTFGPGATTTSVSTTMALDPTLQLIVPDGVTVQSVSGVFPVTYVSAVPEPGTNALMLAGLIAIGCLTLRRNAHSQYVTTGRPRRVE